MPSARITSKGQITLPIEIRKFLGVGVGDRVEFVAGAHGEVVISPQNLPARKLFGILCRPGEGAMTVEEMDVVIIDALADDEARIREAD